MLDDAIRSRIVDDLFDVYRSHRPLPLLTKTYPGIMLEDAYRIQEASSPAGSLPAARSRATKSG